MLGTQAPGPITNRLGPCPADLAALRELRGEARAISKGGHIRVRDGDPEFAVIVLSGLLFRYAQTRNGSRQVVAFYFPGDWASVEALPGAPLRGEIAALTRTKVQLIPFGEIRQLLDKNPRILRLLTIETLFQAGVQSAWLTRNSIMPAIASFAHFLCEVVIRSGTMSPDGTAFCSFPFTQQMVAETLGLTSVHATGALKEQLRVCPRTSVPASERADLGIGSRHLRSVTANDANVAFEPLRTSAKALKSGPFRRDP